MDVDIQIIVYIFIGVLTVGGAVVAFFQMQTKQNMRIKNLELRASSAEKKISDQAYYQIQTEKMVEVINTKLDHIMATLEELKERRK